jgi:hypothetical protein
MLLAAFLTAAAALSPALAQDAKQDFTLVNKTGYALNEAYLAPADSNEWQEDFLGKTNWTMATRRKYTSVQRRRLANGTSKSSTPTTIQRWCGAISICARSTGSRFSITRRQTRRARSSG